MDNLDKNLQKALKQVERQKRAYAQGYSKEYNPVIDKVNNMDKLENLIRKGVMFSLNFVRFFLESPERRELRKNRELNEEILKELRKMNRNA